MIIRIVKMHFKEESIADFLSIFEYSHTKIRAYEGCHHLQLLKDVDDETIFFTLSHWESSAALEKYRKSELFQSTWSKTRPLFKDRAQAWSTAMHTQV
jgi:quinol monooxygenase YgiN